MNVLFAQIQVTVSAKAAQGLSHFLFAPRAHHVVTDSQELAVTRSGHRLELVATENGERIFTASFHEAQAGVVFLSECVTALQAAGVEKVVVRPTLSLLQTVESLVCPVAETWTVSVAALSDFLRAQAARNEALRELAAGS